MYHLPYQSYDRLVKPSKRLGQNFLIDKNVVKKLVDSAELTKDDTVLEVGAGTGALTVQLAKRTKKVLAVEKDRRLITILEENLKDFDNVKIVAGDILKLSSAQGEGEWALVGNIPYYLTAPLIRKFLESEHPPKRIILMVQKEMAQRICAKPPDMSILAVSVQVYAKPKIIAYVSRSAFWPQPQVDSAILRIKNIESRIKNTNLFFKVVKAGFMSPRKQLINNLSKGLEISKEDVRRWLLACGIAPQRRAETLTVQTWITLVKNMVQ